MDESFHELEAELKSLQLRPPSPRLRDRLAAELPPAPAAAPQARPRYTTSTNLSSWKWLGWRSAGLAAAVAVLAAVGLMSFKREPAPAGVATSTQVVASSALRDDYQPVAASNVLYDLKDEGLVKTEDNADARRVRYRYLDTYTWKNPKSNASLKWSVPRDEIRLVSATLN
jgi:hypothetical protein